MVDSRPLLVDHELQSESFHPDFLKDYPDAVEDVASDFPTPVGRELETSVFFDADHGHDHATRRSISGLLVLWVAPRCCGTANARGVSRLVRTAQSLSLCVLPWRRRLQIAICYDVWEYR